MMGIEYILLVALITIGGSFIQRVSGFGFGIFVMIFFPYFFASFGQATTLSGFLAGSTALVVMIRWFKKIRWRILIAPVITYAISSIFAIEILATQPNSLLKKLLGAVMILLGLYFIFMSKKIHIKSNIYTGLFVGLIAGVMGGMFAMPGPPLVVYLIESIKDKKEYVASMQTASVIFNLYATIFRAKEGFVTDEVLICWAVGLVGVVIGIYAGNRVFNQISAKTLKKMVYSLMIASGVMAII